jgi:hypothetical protein
VAADIDIDVPAARAFVTTHGRILDRRRLAVVLDGTPRDGLLAALDAYRNDDGGYGWGLEPDLRSPESQPVAAMQALELLAEVGPTSQGPALCDWLVAHSRPDGGLALARPITDPTGCSPVWLDPDAETSTIQMTAQVAANAHLAARRDVGIRNHPWLPRATGWCLDAIGQVTAPSAHELLFAVRFLDAAAPVTPTAGALLEHLAQFIPADGVIAVQGGAEGEAIRPLDLAPRADGPARQLFAADVLVADRRRLAAGQQADGGWTVDFESASEAGALEWRAYATINALKILTIEP